VISPVRTAHRSSAQPGALTLLLALVLTLCAACSGGPGTSTSDGLIGRTISIPNGTLLDGGTLTSFGEVAGERRILLNFWASWCMPCREEIPLLAAYAAEPTSGAVVIGVLYRDEAALGQTAAATLGATWPTLVDADGAIAAQVPVNAAPLTLLLNSEGIVLDYQVGQFSSATDLLAFAGHP
jgi:cytochrome c biogenesis protein CcmG/thiol:disulfide interchange protein DsbE